MKPLFLAFTILIFGCSSKENPLDFSKNELDYFTEIALGSEFGDSVPVIKKWADNIKIKIEGDPTEADLKTVDEIVSDLNSLISGINIKVVSRNENITITFSPESDFGVIDKNYVPTNYGFFWALWHDDNYVIYNASILISSIDITQSERSHLIREELTQSLGLMNDSDKYEDSIFFQQWTDITTYSDLDRIIIALLYHKKIKPGMTKDQVIEAIT